MPYILLYFMIVSILFVKNNFLFGRLLKSRA